MRLKCPFLLLLFLAGCEGRGRAPATVEGCQAPAILAVLPDNVREASGLAISQHHDNLLWINNDGDARSLFAIDTTGHEHGRVRVLDADITDAEDLATSSCGDATCLYVADIGDNMRVRETAAIFRVREPDPRDSTTAPAEVFRFTYPDGAQDAEAIFVLPGERVYIITKGRSGPVTVYRYPGPLRNELVTLERVQSLSPGIVQFPDMVTGAAATPSGRTIAVRTYAWLQLYHLAGDTLQPLLPEPIDLTPLREAQGEAVDLRADGSIFLASEHGLGQKQAPLSRMKCQLDERP